MCKTHLAVGGQNCRFCQRESDGFWVGTFQCPTQETHFINDFISYNLSSSDVTTTARIELNLMKMLTKNICIRSGGSAFVLWMDGFDFDLLLS